MMNDRAARLAARFQGEGTLGPPAPTSSSAEEAGKRSKTKPRWDQDHQRFTVWLPVELVAKVKVAAKSRGESLAAMVTRALRRELERLNQ
jgi:hypothetical protein